MRISGITIPDNKKLEVALTTLYGVGFSRARQVLKNSGIEIDRKGKDLTTEEENKVREELDKYTLEGELRRQISAEIKRLKDIKSYRGSRHTKNLPARGQRTNVNSRTVRGNRRRTMGSGRK